MNGTTCMELALEGERLCKSGDFKAGVAFFEAAIKVGTTDQRTLSAIYSQLGNAFFYLENYEKALEYHTLDLATTRSICDEVAEAKASGNLGNTLKMLDKFDEAACHCRRHLEISKKLNDKIGEGRALYNLGNVYHTKGKRMVRLDRQNPGELPDDIRACLTRAVGYYEGNLKIVLEFNDLAGVGRAYGNLGNTHYLLGNFEQAVYYHTKRLEIARQFGDRAAERRAQCNLGNANIFLGNFSDAVENYIETLRLAKEIDDRTVEAQACYSLANTYTLLREYDSAIKYHLAYLDMVRELNDRLGEGRSCWSLVNVYQMISDHESALKYAEKHLKIAQEIGDQAGEATAQLNIEELQALLANKRAISNLGSSHDGAGVQSETNADTDVPSGSSQQPASRYKRFSMDRLNLFRLTPDRRHEQEQRRFKKQLNATLLDPIEHRSSTSQRSSGGTHLSVDGKLNKSPSSERLMDLIAHFQSGRIDDQRCEIVPPMVSSSIVAGSAHPTTTGTETAPATDVTSANKLPTGGDRDEKENSMPRVVGTSTKMMNQIRNHRKVSLSLASGSSMSSTSANVRDMRRPTISSQHRDELFDLIAGAQNQRMEEQRASFPALSRAANGVLAGLADHTNRNINFAPRPDLIPDPVVVRSANDVNNGDERDENNGPSTSSMTSAPQAASSSSDQLSSTTSVAQGSTRSSISTRDNPPKNNDTQSNEKFFDLLMKCQSTRLDDQRVSLADTKSIGVNNPITESTRTVDIPSNNKSTNVANHGVNQRLKERSSSVCVSGMGPDHRATRNRGRPNDPDDFFNLILRIQSNRLDDQRSNLPPTTTTNNG